MSRLPTRIPNPPRPHGVVAVALLFLSCLVLPMAQAASFDCKKASTAVEKSICANPELSFLDEILTSTYQKVIDVATDRSGVHRYQREWLTKIRDACQDEGCLKNTYIARYRELSKIAFKKPGTGVYRCSFRKNLTDNSDLGIIFEISDGVVNNFYAATTVSSPDLALGYSNTCIQHAGNFVQTHGDGAYVLQYFSHGNQYGESPSCQVRIAKRNSKLHVYTSNCRSVCMNFNFTVLKSDCHSAM